MQNTLKQYKLIGAFSCRFILFLAEEGERL